MTRREQQQDIMRWENVTPLGSYRTVVPVAMPNAQVANAELMALRWTSTTADLIVDRIELYVTQSAAAATAETQGDVRLFKCVQYTVADSAGTVVSPQRKNRFAHGNSAVNDLRVTAAAAGLTVGTRTLEANPIAGCAYRLKATAADINITYGSVMDFTTGATYPEVITAREVAGGVSGLILRSTAAHPATGAAVLYIVLDWTEVPAGAFDA